MFAEPASAAAASAEKAIEQNLILGPLILNQKLRPRDTAGQFVNFYPSSLVFENPECVWFLRTERSQSEIRCLSLPFVLYIGPSYSQPTPKWRWRQSVSLQLAH